MLDPPVTAEGYLSVCPLFKDQERVHAVDGMWNVVQHIAQHTGDGDSPL